MRNVWVRLGLVVLAAGVIPWASLRAQNFPGPLMNATGGGLLPLPEPEPEGVWAEVIFSNPKWLVVQNNQTGRQFPVAYEAVDQFLIRWPITLNELNNQAVVEATGMDLGSNVLQTDHIDVFLGPDQALATPAYNSTLPGNRGLTVLDPSYNRTLNAWDFAAQAALYGWAYPVDPPINPMVPGNMVGPVDLEEMGNPAMLHVVGNVVALNPLLRLSVPGNIIATVFPAPGGMTITQVTLGTPTFVQAGDRAFLMPMSVEPKTLVLSRLVIFKSIARRQFAVP